MISVLRPYHSISGDQPSISDGGRLTSPPRRYLELARHALVDVGHGNLDRCRLLLIVHSALAVLRLLSSVSLYEPTEADLYLFFEGSMRACAVPSCPGGQP